MRLTAVSVHNVNTSDRAAAVAVAKHVGGVTKSAVLLVGALVGDHILPARGVEAAREGVVPLVVVQLAVLGGVPRAGDARKDALGGGLDVAVLPARGEVVIEILGIGLFMSLVRFLGKKEALGLFKYYLPPKPCVNRRAAAQNATGHLVCVGTCYASCGGVSYRYYVRGRLDHLLESDQISLHKPGTSNLVKLVPSSQSGPRSPPHWPVDTGPFSISNTEWPASLNLSATGMPPAPAPTMT